MANTSFLSESLPASTSVHHLPTKLSSSDPVPSLFRYLPPFHQLALLPRFRQRSRPVIAKVTHPKFKQAHSLLDLPLLSLRVLRATQATGAPAEAFQKRQEAQATISLLGSIRTPTIISNQDCKEIDVQWGRTAFGNLTSTLQWHHLTDRGGRFPTSLA